MAATLELTDLLRVIDEDFDNSAHWHPLADWLIEHDDPRGELINIDLALEAGDGDIKALLARRLEILEASAPALLGDTFSRVIKDGYGKVTWRRGFVDTVQYVGSPHLQHRKAVGWLIKLMTTVHEPFAFLRELDISYTDITDVTVFKRFSHLRELKIEGCQPTLASLTILDEEMLDLEVIGRYSVA
jgi:uncharacterized protein (TIGR02996 family)